ncbi:MAG: hypothetical protein OSJ37_04040 [Muribaculaceae bacterium]|jgi:hypothetical protein|nr:hypothetical protein [Muribaculaceae bacterium]
MDISDFIVGIGVLLVIIASEVSGRKKKKEVRSTPMQNRAHVSPPAYRPQPKPPTPKSKPPTLKRPAWPAATPSAAKPFLAGNEGARVTSSEKTPKHEFPKTTVAKEPADLKQLTRDNLRNAVIWSEILRPKF